MYHYLGARQSRGPHAALTVPAEEFASHLRALTAMGRRTVTSADYEAALVGEPAGRACDVRESSGTSAGTSADGEAGLAAGGARRDVAWITFDDGTADNHELALPLLADHGHRATFFVIAERCLGGAPGYMGPAALREMIAAGMEIGSHTLTHPRLARLDADAMRREVHDSKARLEDALQVPVRAFCYPYGNWSPAVVEEVRRAGYALAPSTIRDNRNTPADRYTLRRIMVQPGRTGWRFRYAFSPLYHWLHARKNRRRWKEAAR